MGSHSPFGDLKPKLNGQKFWLGFKLLTWFSTTKTYETRVKWHLIVTSNPTLENFPKRL
jgi:hypothetical protein